MDRESLAYMEGFREVLQAHGVEKQASDAMLEKVAQYFGGYGYEPPSMLDRVTDKAKSALPYLLGLAAILGTGYVTYKAGIEGDPNKSFLENSKNYMTRLGDKLVRRKRPRPWYDYRKYFDNIG